MIEQTERFETIQDLLKGEYILIHVDTNHEGVEIPPHLLSQKIVTLKLSYLFQGRLTIDQEEIISDLKFHGNYFTCRVPITSIKAVTSEKGEVQYFENIPQDQKPKGKPKLVRVK